MRIGSKVPRLMRVGVCVIWLVPMWTNTGCAARMAALTDAPIRVKNTKLEVELLSPDPQDVWDPDHGEFTPRRAKHSHSDIDVYASKYSGDLCPVFQPYKAKTVILEYGPTTGKPTKVVTIRVLNKKYKVRFDGATGGSKTLEFSGGPSDYLRSLRVEHPHHQPITCTATEPSENMVVTLR